LHAVVEIGERQPVVTVDDGEAAGPAAVVVVEEAVERPAPAIIALVYSVYSILRT
jgi:hypothetical protein